MDLYPSLDEPPLGRREAAAQTLNRVDRKNRCLVLIVRVEVWPMVRPAGFNKHPNDDLKEPRQRRHVFTLPSSPGLCRANRDASAAARTIRRRRRLHAIVGADHRAHTQTDRPEDPAESENTARTRKTRVRAVVRRRSQHAAQDEPRR